MNPPGLETVGLLRLDEGDARARAEPVVVETPVALLYNGRPHAVMMATPTDLHDFALGFALTEGIVADAGEFALVDTTCGDEGIALHAAIPQPRFDALDARQRTQEGRSGCGLCGKQSLADVVRPVAPVSSGLRFDATRIHGALDALAARQPLNAASGGVHAAAFVHGDGVLVREDVGRHNALDKTIGALVRAGLRAGDGFVVATSRASFEIVHKAATMGVPLVVAISAPTTLAVRLADAAGLTLVAFARGGAMNVYTHAGRIVPG